MHIPLESTTDWWTYKKILLGDYFVKIEINNWVLLTDKSKSRVKRKEGLEQTKKRKRWKER